MPSVLDQVAGRQRAAHDNMFASGAPCPHYQVALAHNPGPEIQTSIALFNAYLMGARNILGNAYRYAKRYTEHGFL
jgi:hypothetical protein